MKITGISAYLQHLPLREPYSIAYQTVTDTEIIFLEITLANGMVGYGASNPFPEVTGETPAQTLSLLQSDITRKWIGRDIEDMEFIIHESYELFPHYPGAHAALDIALHDALGKYKGVPVIDLYGKKIEPLYTSITIGIKPVGEMLEDAARSYAQGFRVIKVKTGISVDEDIERITKLSEKLGSSVQLRVDANLGYNLNDLHKFISATNKLQLELIEQPLPVMESNKLISLDENLRSKLVADESLTDIRSAEQLVQKPHMFGVFNIKLMKAGGILAAKKIADLANNNGISIFWGCNDESLVSIAAALHIAYACQNTKYLDLDGSFDVMENLFQGGFLLRDGRLHITGEPGLGLHKIH